MDENPIDPASKGRSQYIGLAGEYYVVYSLLVRRLHASVVGGNVPNIDVLVSSGDGYSQISLQVNTARSAYRKKRWGHEAFEWHVGRSAVGRASPNHWYAFVDLQENEASAWNPVVYLVPSLWVKVWVSRSPDSPMQIYPLKAAAAELCRERWDHLSKIFARDPSVLALTHAIPKVAAWE